MTAADALRLDGAALHAALDAQRRARNMTWQQVAQELHVSTTTLARTRQGGRMETDGVLQMTRWLGGSVESFVRGADATPAGTAARPVTMSGILRFDTKALHAALDERRRARGMTWRQVAEEIGVAASMLTRLAGGGRVEVNWMLAYMSWLGRPVASFTYVSDY